MSRFLRARRLRDSITGESSHGLRPLLMILPFAAAACARPNDSADPALTSYIGAIRAIDSHAHPMRVVAAGAPADSEYDALPLDGIPPFPMPARLRLEDAQWRDAQRALYSLTSTDTGEAWQAAVARERARIQQEQGDHFPAWALDKSGIDVMLANRIVLGAGLAAPRFRWVAFADPLMLPLDSRNEALRTPDTKSLYPKEAKLLQRYMRDASLEQLPSTLGEYVNRLLRPTLERQKQGGAVAIKFEAAYLRPLDFDNPDSAAATRVYAKYAHAGAPSLAEYKALEDYLFRVICREAGRLGLAVQIHALEGFGGFFSSRGSAPDLLEPALSDSTLRATTFVIVHGGWPLVDETQALLSRPNVYTDISAMVLYVEPARIAQVLRQWLAEWPEHVMFGSDAFDGGPSQSWPEVAYAGTRTARSALGLALTHMLRDGEIDRRRAQRLASMVLHDNAEQAYRLKPAN